MMDGYMPFEKLESHVLEVKDLSGAKDVADWKQLYITVSAFLNTDGGLVLCGIKENEKEKTYKLTGFNSEHEDKIRAELTSGNHFTDDERNLLKLDHRNISFKLSNFRGKQIGVVNVHPFADDEKFVFYRKTNSAYIREMTGDKKLTQAQLEAHQEYKRELEYARELRPVPNATIEDLDLGKIQQIIKAFTAKSSFQYNIPDTLQAAIPFLESNSLMQGGQVTLMGVLTCSKKPYALIGGRCTVDCYVESEGEGIVVSDRRHLRDTIPSLMDEAYRFVLRNIRMATRPENGGTATPDYSFNLIREVILNATAHRDYKPENSVIIIVHLNEKLEIRNSGTFKHKMIVSIAEDQRNIRRIVPPKGMAESKNPKLAQLLKNMQTIESRGVGMTTIVEEALNNKIDLPYYLLTYDSIVLFIPKGKIYDDKMKAILGIYNHWIEDKFGKKLTEEAWRVLSYLYKAEDNDGETRATILLTEENNHLQVIKKLLDSQLIETHPKSPNNYPVYRVNRQLRQLKYHDELKKIYGEAEFEALTYDERDVLNAVYIYQNFGTQEGKTSDFYNAIIPKFMYFNTYHKFNFEKYTGEFGTAFTRAVRNLADNKQFIEFKENIGYQLIRPKLGYPSNVGQFDNQ